MQAQAAAADWQVVHLHSEPLPDREALRGRVVVRERTAERTSDHKHTHAHAFGRTRMHLHTRMLMHLHAHSLLRARAHTHTHARTCICTHAHIQHTRARAHAHAKTSHARPCKPAHTGGRRAKPDGRARQRRMRRYVFGVQVRLADGRSVRFFNSHLARFPYGCAC
jgi:hypothetical protein